MINIVIVIDDQVGRKRLTVEKVSQWIGEAIANPDVRDSDMGIQVHNINIEMEA